MSACICPYQTRQLSNWSVSQIQGSRLLQISLKLQSLSFIAWLPQHSRIPFADVHQPLCNDYIPNSGLKIRLCSGNTNRVGLYRPFSIFLPGYLNIKPSHEHLHDTYPYHLNRFALTSTLCNASLTDHSFKFCLMFDPMNKQFKRCVQVRTESDLHTQDKTRDIQRDERDSRGFKHVAPSCSSCSSCSGGFCL